MKVATVIFVLLLAVMFIAITFTMGTVIGLMLSVNPTVVGVACVVLLGVLYGIVFLSKRK